MHRNNNFGLKLSLLREGLGLTQKAFGRKLNRSGATISQWEQLNEPRSRKQVAFIEQTFNCPGYFGLDSPDSQEPQPPKVRSLGEELKILRVLVAEQLSVSPDRVRLEVIEAVAA